jgi:phosphinothricin acetyltransferase
MPYTTPATADDATLIAAIYNESIRAGDSTMDEVSWTAEEVLRQMAAFNEREGYLLHKDEGQVLGWGVIKRYSDRSGYRFTCETALYLRRNLTGQGYGTALQEALIERCRQWGYHHVVTRIWADNLSSLALHQKLGFKLVGVQKEVGFKQGRWIDVAIMQMLLPAP